MSAKKVNPAEPLLEKISIGVDKIKTQTQYKLYSNKKDHLREHLRRIKSAGN